MAVYNKLVRDRIPEIIEVHGETPIVRVLEQDEYTRALRQKLGEEVAEFLESGDAEELADIMEVVLALASAGGTSHEQLESIRLAKREARGGFEKRLFLITKS